MSTREVAGHEPAVEAWGIDRVDDVLEELPPGVDLVIVRDGGEGGRLLTRDQLRAVDADTMLDLVPGGVPIAYADAGAAELPRTRPLAVRRDGELVGVLRDVGLEAERRQALVEAWRLPTGGADARAAAMEAVNAAKQAFRRRRVALVLDIQPSRVAGDGLLVRDALDLLLEESLEVLRICGGGTAVHVRVQHGPSGLWMSVEDRGSRVPAVGADAYAAGAPAGEEPGAGSVRRLRARIERDHGELHVEDTPSGTRFVVLLRGPDQEAA